MGGAFPAIVGLGLMAVTGYVWYRRRLLLRDGMRVTGTISGFILGLVFFLAPFFD